MMTVPVMMTKTAEKDEEEVKNDEEDEEANLEAPSGT
jgi:hypothetical protein